MVMLKSLFWRTYFSHLSRKLADPYVYFHSNLTLETQRFVTRVIYGVLHFSCTIVTTVFRPLKLFSLLKQSIGKHAFSNKVGQTPRGVWDLLQQDDQMGR